MKTGTKLVIATAAAAAVAVFRVPASFAFGNAPWCAVVNLGMGDVYWDCQYRTVEECVPNVIAGNRGFCNLNPWGPSPGSGAGAPLKRHSKHHVRRD
jgi:hypothetical protein